MFVLTGFCVNNCHNSTRLLKSHRNKKAINNCNNFPKPRQQTICSNTIEENNKEKTVFVLAASNINCINATIIKSRSSGGCLTPPLP